LLTSETAPFCCVYPVYLSLEGNLKIIKSASYASCVPIL
jgi:hypothetical protein